MITGIGNDIIKTERIRALLERQRQSFIQRIFTEAERTEAAARHNEVEYYAGRWAAKEALSKALGCGIGKDCSWQDVCIIKDQAGKPIMTLSGNAAKRAEAINAAKVHVSISHEHEYACAVVILETEN